MASTFFFNGQLFTTPAVMTQVNDTAMQPTSLTVGNVLALIGQCSDGQPNTPFNFGNPADVAAVFGTGDLATAAAKAFNPSNDTNINAPGLVVGIRVGTSTQAVLPLLDGSGNPVISLQSNSYGVGANLTKISVATGSSGGKLISTGKGTSFYTGDNLTRSAFTVRYSGAQASATMTVGNTSVTLAAPAGTTVATIPLATYPTVGQLVDRINGTAGFAATVSAGSLATPALNGLDSVTSQDVKTATYTAKADLQAVIDWLNTVDTLVTATRITAAGAPPVNVGWTYLSGGTDPAILVGDWTTALTVLQSVDCQWVAPLTSDPAVHAATDAHVQFMSAAGRKERRALVGPALATSLSQVQALPLALNSDRTSMCWPGYYDFDANGLLTLYPPYMLASIIAAAFSGTAPGTPLTNKTLNIRGLETVIRNPTDTDPLIQSGVLVVEATKSGFKPVRSISTWLANNKFNRVEQSCGAATDFAIRNLRDAVGVIKGSRGDPLILQRAITIATTALNALSVPQPEGPGILVGDKNSPPWQALSAKLIGDVVAISVQISPVIPVNFVPITVSLVPFSGSASA